MKDAIMIFAVFSQMLFWCVCGIVGYTFEGSEDSPIFKIVVAFFSVLACGIFFISMFRKEIYLNKSFWLFCVFLPLFILGMYYLETGIFSLGGRLSSTILFMAAFSLPAILEAMYIAQKGIASFAKWMDVISIVITLSMLSSSIQALVGRSSIGGASYQIVSYYSAFGFCSVLCMILWGDKYERFSVFKNKVWEITSYVSLVILMVACLMSGGRGGFLVLAACSTYMLFRAGKIGKTLGVAIFAVLLLGMVSMFFPENPVYDKLEKTTQRTFSYLSSEKEGATNRSISERDNLYTDAFQYVEDHNYLGAGFFHANIDFGFYPHNIILEMLMQGGALYLIFWIVIWIVFAKKLLNNLKKDNANIILPIVFLSFLSLMFSYSYMELYSYWFVLAYVFCRSELKNI